MTIASKKIEIDLTIIHQHTNQHQPEHVAIYHQEEQ